MYADFCHANYMSTNIHTHTFIHAYIQPYIHTYIYTCTYIHTYIHTFGWNTEEHFLAKNKNIRTYIHTYIHAYKHTHTHTYICTYEYTFGTARKAWSTVALSCKKNLEILILLIVSYLRRLDICRWYVHASFSWSSKDVWVVCVSILTPTWQGSATDQCSRWDLCLGVLIMHTSSLIAFRRIPFSPMMARLHLVGYRWGLVLELY